MLTTQFGDFRPLSSNLHCSFCSGGFFACSLATFCRAFRYLFVLVQMIFQESRSKVLDYSLFQRPSFSTEIFSGLSTRLVEASMTS